VMESPHRARRAFAGSCDVGTVATAAAAGPAHPQTASNTAVIGKSRNKRGNVMFREESAVLPSSKDSPASGIASYMFQTATF